MEESKIVPQICVTCHFDEKGFDNRCSKCINNNLWLQKKVIHATKEITLKATNEDGKMTYSWEQKGFTKLEVLGALEVFKSQILRDDNVL